MISIVADQLQTTEMQDFNTKQAMSCNITELVMFGPLLVLVSTY
jgi:hypothetical protein